MCCDHKLREQFLREGDKAGKKSTNTGLVIGRPSTSTENKSV